VQIGAAEGQEFPAAFGGDDPCGLKESNKLIPGQFRAPRDNVDEIESQAAPNEPQPRCGRERHNSFTLAYWLGPWMGLRGSS